MNLIMQISTDGKAWDSSQVLHNYNEEMYKAVILSTAGFSCVGIRWRVIDVDTGEIKAQG